MKDYPEKTAGSNFYNIWAINFSENLKIDYLTMSIKYIKLNFHWNLRDYTTVT